MTEPVVYSPADRPMVAVLEPGPGPIGTWYIGELRMWTKRENGWWGNVGYSRGPAQNHLDTFPAERIVQLE